MRIFLTGASGCIGHYIAEALIRETEHELFLLVRDPNKLKFDYQCRAGVSIIPADLREIEKYSPLLATIDVAILAATAWGGSESYEINVVKNISLIDLLDPEVCQQVIYFSTASILDRNHRLLPQAGEIGTDYIKSKYSCFSQIDRSAIASKITTLFPTLILGGDADKPKSHLSSGLPEVIKWMDLIRFFKADGSFHFIHAKDVARVVVYLIEHPPSHPQLVLGNACLSVNEAIAEICAYLNKKIYFRIPLSIWLADFFIWLFRIQMATWDRFCLNYRHFTYQNVVNPSMLGLSSYCPTLTDAMRISGILSLTSNQSNDNKE